MDSLQHLVHLFIACILEVAVAFSSIQHTDICAHALEALDNSKIRHVHIIGRRGPLQVSFYQNQISSREIYFFGKRQKFRAAYRDMLTQDLAHRTQMDVPEPTTFGSRPQKTSTGLGTVLGHRREPILRGLGTKKYSESITVRCVIIKEHGAGFKKTFRLGNQTIKRNSLKLRLVVFLKDMHDRTLEKLPVIMIIIKHLIIIIIIIII